MGSRGTRRLEPQAPQPVLRPMVGRGAVDCMGQAGMGVMVEPEGPEAAEARVATAPMATAPTAAPAELGEMQGPEAQAGTGATGATRGAGVATPETGALERATTMAAPVARAEMDLGRRWAMEPLAGREEMAERPLERARADLAGRAELEVVRSAMDRLVAMGATEAMEDPRRADRVGTEAMVDRADLVPGQRQPRETVAVEGTAASGPRLGTLGSVVRVDMGPVEFVVRWVQAWSTSGNSCFTGTLSRSAGDCLCPCSNMRPQVLKGWKTKSARSDDPSRCGRRRRPKGMLTGRERRMGAALPIFSQPVSSRAQACSVTKTGSTRISATRERPYRKWSWRLPHRCCSIHGFQASLSNP
jgi:hypothetical protein